MENDDKDSKTGFWKYQTILICLVVLAFTFEMGSFLAYGLEFFPALTFFQHIVLVVASIPNALIIAIVFSIMIFLYSTTRAAAGRTFSFLSQKSQRINEAEPGLRKYAGKIFHFLIPVYFAHQWVTATNTLYFITTFLLMVVGILTFGPTKLMPSEDSSTAEKQLACLIGGLFLLLVAGLGNIHGKATISKDSPYDDLFCIENSCTSVRMIMAFENAALYAEDDFVVYHPYDGDTEVRIRIKEEKSLLDILTAPPADDKALLKN